MKASHRAATRLAATALAMAVIGGSTLSLAQQAPEAASGRVILSERHFWRKLYTFFPPSLSLESAKTEGLPADADSRAAVFAKTHDCGIRTPPPSEWKSPDFPDSDWLLRRGREFFSGDGRIHGPTLDEDHLQQRASDPFIEHVGLVHYRGKFFVKDRAKAGKLVLSLTYRGGFVAYLNGKEVARGDLPAGNIAPTTPARDYPLAAWFYAEDTSKKKTKGHYLDAFDAAAPWHLRERTFGPKEIPSDALRDGMNVLAIELHRSDYPLKVAKTKSKAPWQRSWGTVGMGLLSLRTDASAEVILDPGPVAPAGLKVWAVDITREVSTRAAPALDENSGPVMIAAARNGSFNAMLVAASDKPLENLTVKVSDLKRADGKGVIAASAVTIRYAVANPFWPTQMGYYGPIGVNFFGAVIPVEPRAAKQADLGNRLDVLLDAPPVPAVPTVGVWLTVQVPENVTPGLYKGEVTVGAVGGRAATVPVEVSVADWTLPDVKDYTPLWMIYQSPESLAEYYKVEPWSETHWKLIERSLKLMGEGGNVGLQLNLLAKGCLGNEDSWVVWEKKPDGAYDYDFILFDRYVKTAMKYHDPARMKMIVLNVWGIEAGKVYAGNAEKYGNGKSGSVLVTVRDRATGKKADFGLPPYGSAECEKLLKPLLLAAQRHLEGFGLADRILWGKSSDDYPLPEHVAMLDRIIPGTPWYRESHWDCQSFPYGPASDKSKMVPVGASAVVWGGHIPPPSEKRFHGWQYNPKHIVFNFNRPGVDCLVLLGFPKPWSYHMWMESTIACGRNGNGNVGGDFWPIGPGGYNGGGTFCGRYPQSNQGRNGVGNNTIDLFGPGPDGPVPTIRFQNALENNQESEARIFIEKALLDREKPLLAELARQCREILDERTNVLRYESLGAGALAPYQWQERNRRLFEAAAKVEQALTK